MEVVEELEESTLVEMRIIMKKKALEEGSTPVASAEASGAPAQVPESSPATVVTELSAEDKKKGTLGETKYDLYSTPDSFIRPRPKWKIPKVDPNVTFNDIPFRSDVWEPFAEYINVTPFMICIHE